MRKHLVILVALAALALAAPTFAQDNSSARGGGESADATVFKALCAGSGCAFATGGNYYAARYQCTDPTLTSSTLSGAVADCCIAGDIWHMTVFKTTKASKFSSTANVASSTPGALAFAPDIYSPNATVASAVKKIDAVVTIGNSAPGGLPAGATARFISNGLGLACSRKQVVNGTADPVPAP